MKKVVILCSALVFDFLTCSEASAVSQDMINSVGVKNSRTVVMDILSELRKAARSAKTLGVRIDGKPLNVEEVYKKGANTIKSINSTHKLWTGDLQLKVDEHDNVTLNSNNQCLPRGLNHLREILNQIQGEINRLNGAVEAERRRREARQNPLSSSANSSSSSYTASSSHPSSSGSGTNRSASGTSDSHPSSSGSGTGRSAPDTSDSHPSSSGSGTGGRSAPDTSDSHPSNSGPGTNQSAPDTSDRNSSRRNFFDTANKDSRPSDAEFLGVELRHIDTQNDTNDEEKQPSEFELRLRKQKQNLRHVKQSIIERELTNNPESNTSTPSNSRPSADSSNNAEFLGVELRHVDTQAASSSDANTPSEAHPSLNTSSKESRPSADSSGDAEFLGVELRHVDTQNDANDEEKQPSEFELRLRKQKQNLRHVKQSIIERELTNNPESNTSTPSNSHLSSDSSSGAEHNFETAPSSDATTPSEAHSSSFDTADDGSRPSSASSSDAEFLGVELRHVDTQNDSKKNK